MGIVTVNEENLTNIANAIRGKNQTEATYKPSEMAEAIGDLPAKPKQGLVINKYNSNGYATDVSIIGLTSIPNRYLTYFTYDSYNIFKEIRHSSQIHFPNNLTSLGESAFSYCTNFYSLEFPDSITSIGKMCFQSCRNLQLTKLPDALKSLGDLAFDGCSNLSLTSLPNGITSIKRRTFYSCSNLQLTELPDGVTTIGEEAFYSCGKLALTNLPSSLTSIGKGAFTSCATMTIEEIPAGVTELLEKAFYGCRGITKLIINGDLTSIHGSSYAGSFYSCTNLETIALPNVTSVPTMNSSYAFEGTKIQPMGGNVTGYIYVPDALVDSFKSATNWSTYANQIKPISEMPTE